MRIAPPHTFDNLVGRTVRGRLANKARKHWYIVKSSFWFLPSIIVTVAAGLALGFSYLDALVGPGRLAEIWPMLFKIGPDGSRDLLTALATSMITVAGVVFSITLVALTLTTSQYTSRVLRNFMRDKATQSVLGVFVGIFAYCLVLLRTLEADGDVPQLAVMFALLLAFVGIGFFIFFIHHISSSIQASHIIRTVMNETIGVIDDVFEDGQGEPKGFASPEKGESWQTIPASQTGYIQQIQMAVLFAYGEKHDVLLRVEHAIGEFLIEGTPVVSVLTTKRLDDDDIKALGTVCTVGTHRTPEEDVLFGIRQLVDVAMKALSPGINDTTTAIMSIDHLTAILAKLSRKTITKTHWRDDEGKVRVLTPHAVTFDEMVAKAFDQIRHNGQGNAAILLRQLGSLEVLGECCGDDLGGRRRILLEHAQAIAEAGNRTLESPRDRRAVSRRAEEVMALLAEK